MNFRSIRPAATAISGFPIPSLNTRWLANGMPAFIQNTPDLAIVKLELYWAKDVSVVSAPFVSSLATELLFSGNATISEEAIIKKLDYYGVSYSMDSSVSNSSLSIRFQKKHAAIVIPWVLQNISAVDYPQIEVENAIMVRSAGIERQQQTPKYWSNRLALQSLYGETNPLARFGEISDLEKINSEILREYKNNFLNPGSSMLFLSGDVTEEIIQLVEKEISVSSTHPFTPPKKENKPYTVPDERLVTKSLPLATQVSLQMIRHIVPENTRERHVLTLLNLVLGGYFGSRLMQELREKQGLTYGIGSYFKSALDDYSWIISGEMNSSNMENVQNAITSIFEGLKSNLIDSEELNKLKQYYSGVFRSGFDGPFALAAKVQTNIMKHQDERYYTTVLDKIWSISSEEINAVAHKYLNNEQFLTSLSGNI